MIVTIRKHPGLTLFAATALAMALVGTAVILASPSTGLPVGASVATGDSMGEAQPQVVIYGPAGEYEPGDVAVFSSSAGWLRHQRPAPAAKPRSA